MDPILFLFPSRLREIGVPFLSKTYTHPWRTSTSLSTLKSWTSRSCPCLEIPSCPLVASLVAPLRNWQLFCHLLLFPQLLCWEVLSPLQCRQSPRTCSQLLSALHIFLFLQVSLTHIWPTSTSCAMTPKSSRLAPGLLPRYGHLNASKLTVNVIRMPSMPSPYHLRFPLRPSTKPHGSSSSSSPVTASHLIGAQIPPGSNPKQWCSRVHALLGWMQKP